MNRPKLSIKFYFSVKRNEIAEFLPKIVQKSPLWKMISLKESYDLQGKFTQSLIFMIVE